MNRQVIGCESVALQAIYLFSIIVSRWLYKPSLLSAYCVYFQLNT